MTILLDQPFLVGSMWHNIFFFSTKKDDEGEHEDIGKHSDEQQEGEKDSSDDDNDDDDPNDNDDSNSEAESGEEDNASDVESDGKMIFASYCYLDNLRKQFF